MEGALGRIPVLLAPQKTSKNLSSVVVIVSRVVAWAASAIEGMTVGGTKPSLMVAVAVAELADLVYPRPILDVLVVVVLAVEGVSRHLINVHWATLERVTAGVMGRMCDDKMGPWGGRHSRKVLCGTRGQGVLGVQEEWGVDSAEPGGVLRRKYLGVTGFVRMVRGRRLRDCRFGLLELKQVPGAFGGHAEVAEVGVVNLGHDLTLRATEKCVVYE